MSRVRIILGDCRDTLRMLPDGSVHCVVTSPPYWRLRSYLPDDHPQKAAEVGMERAPAAYAEQLVGIFREVRRVLRSRGTAWLNLGDTYAASGKGGGGNRGDRKNWSKISGRTDWSAPPPGFKRKDITLAPFVVAEALRADGWYLRAVIVWAKPTAHEPLRDDRPAVSHEYLFQLSASDMYDCTNPGEPWWGHSVWTIPMDAHDHEATMPEELARRCIVAGCPVGGTVLDPFAGSGTVGAVAVGNARSAVLCELNPEYIEMARQRVGPMFVEVV